MYDIDEVMEVANSAAMENANPFGKFLTSSSPFSWLILLTMCIGES